MKTRPYVSTTGPLFPATRPLDSLLKGAKPPVLRRIALLALFACQPAFALEPVNLGAASHFTILAGAAVTTTGGGIINGDVGASPIAGSAIQLTREQVNGVIYTVDASGPAGSVVNPSLLTAAKGAITTAYNDAAGRSPTPSGPNLNPGAGNIGGMNLSPGLYKFTGSAFITGANLTLTGGPDDVWIFQIASDLQVGSAVQIILAGGAEARNIFWQVGTSAVIETFAVFKGIILADQSITMKSSSTMDGKALAFSAGVTFNGTVGTLPTPETPHFTAITRTPGGAVTLNVETTPYFPLTLETSTSMSPTTWTKVLTTTPVSTNWSYTHPANEATGPKRFYRAFLTHY